MFIASTDGPDIRHILVSGVKPDIKSGIWQDIRLPDIIQIKIRSFEDNIKTTFVIIFSLIQLKNIYCNIYMVENRNLTGIQLKIRAGYKRRPDIRQLNFFSDLETYPRSHTNVESSSGVNKAQNIYLDTLYCS